MGYEVVLLPCPAEVDGAAAIEWFEQYEEPDGDEGLSPQALDAWRRVVADAQALRPGAELEASDEHAELTWPDDGLVVEFWPDEATVSLAYWHDGASAVQLLEIVYRLSAIVSSHTGMRGYDRQLRVLIDDARPDDVAAAYARGRAARS